MTRTSNQDHHPAAAMAGQPPTRRQLQTVPTAPSSAAAAPVSDRAATPPPGCRTEAEISELFDTVSSEPAVLARLGAAVEDLRRVGQAKRELQQLTPQELRAGLESRTRALRPTTISTTGGGV